MQTVQREIPKLFANRPTNQQNYKQKPSNTKRCGNSPFGKCHSTLSTLKRPLTSMSAHVRSNRGGLGEAFSTHRASVWFLSCVRPQVCHQVCWLGKGFGTVNTLEWFFAGMPSHVNSQRRFARERFATGFALKLLFLRYCGVYLRCLCNDGVLNEKGHIHFLHSKLVHDKKQKFVRELGSSGESYVRWGKRGRDEEFSRWWE